MITLITAAVESHTVLQQVDFSRSSHLKSSYLSFSWLLSELLLSQSNQLYYKFGHITTQEISVSFFSILLNTLTTFYN